MVGGHNSRPWANTPPALIFHAISNQSIKLSLVVTSRVTIVDLSWSLLPIRPTRSASLRCAVLRQIVKASSMCSWNCVTRAVMLCCVMLCLIYEIINLLFRLGYWKSCTCRGTLRNLPCAYGYWLLVQMRVVLCYVVLCCVLLFCVVCVCLQNN